MGKRADEQYDDKEAQSRTETALRAAFATPHKTYKETKLGKRRPAKAGPRPASRQKRDDRS